MTDYDPIDEPLDHSAMDNAGEGGAGAELMLGLPTDAKGVAQWLMTALLIGGVAWVLGNQWFSLAAVVLYALLTSAPTALAARARAREGLARVNRLRNALRGRLALSAEARAYLDRVVREGCDPTWVANKVIPLAAGERELQADEVAKALGIPR